MCCARLAENTGRKNDAKNRHLRTIAQFCRAISSQLRHMSTIGKNVKQQFLLHMSHNMVNFGPLATEIGPVVWGTPANFNGFRVLAALLYGTVVVGVSQSLWRWTEGATYIRQGGHHVGHWPTFLVYIGADPSTTLWGPTEMVRAEDRSSKAGVLGEGCSSVHQLGV